MAKTLKKFAFRTPGNPGRYPWKEWQDGRPWQIKRGEDFDREPEEFRKYILIRAKKHGLTVRTSVNGDTLTFQFIRKSKKTKR